MTYSAQLTEKRASMIERAETIVREAQEMVRELSPEEDKAVADALEEVKELDEQIRRHVELEQRATQALEARKENNVEQAVTTIKSEPRTYAPKQRHLVLARRLRRTIQQRLRSVRAFVSSHERREDRTS
jgi:hemerythrin-like domain-containing protein